MKRVLCARAPRFDRGSRKLMFDAASVGVLRWISDVGPPRDARTPAYASSTSWLTVVVKSAVEPAGGEPAVWVRPSPLTLEDLAPYRARVDVLLRGVAPGGPVRIACGRFQRSLRAAPSAGGTALTNEAGAPLSAPDFDLPEPVEPGVHGVPTGEPEAYQRAPDALRARPEDLGDELTLELADGRRLRWALPEARPRVIVRGATEGSEDREIEPLLDTISIDPATARLDVVFRAALPTLRPDARDVDGLVIGFATPSPDFDVRDVLRELPRGEFGWAWERGDLERGEPPPPLDDDTLAIARYETWDAPEGPLPSISLQRFASISAELGEQREPREKVLARHELDPYRWDVEERAWAEAMGEPPPDEDDPRESIAEGYARFFAEAQDALATPDEAKISPETYADLTVAMEREEPPKVLAARGMGLGTYQRLDRRMRARAAAEPAFAEELEELMGSRRAGSGVDDAEEGT